MSNDGDGWTAEELMRWQIEETLTVLKRWIRARAA